MLLWMLVYKYPCEAMLWTLLEYLPRSGIAGWHENSMFNFWRHCYYSILNYYLKVPLFLSLDGKDHDENYKVCHITMDSQHLAWSMCPINTCWMNMYHCRPVAWELNVRVEHGSSSSSNHTTQLCGLPSGHFSHLIF